MGTQKNMASWLKCGEFREKELGHNLEKKGVLEGKIHGSKLVKMESSHEVFSE